MSRSRARCLAIATDQRRFPIELLGERRTKQLVFRRLECDAHDLGAPGTFDRREIGPRDVDGGARWRKDSRCKTSECGLPCPVWPENPADLSRLQGQRGARENRSPTGIG